MTGDIQALAQEYLELRERVESRDVDVGELREEREKWEKKMEKLDEDDPLFEVARENYEEADEKLSEGEESENRFSELEQEFLETVARKFVPRGEWVSLEVLRGINLCVLGEDRGYIEISTVRIEEGREIEDDEKLFDIAISVRDVVDEEIGESSELEEFWKEFSDLKRYELFEEVALAEEPVTGKDVAERLGEEENRQSISQTLIDTTDGAVNPYYKQGRGEYSLSFVGEYLFQNFASIEVNEDDEDDEDKTEEESEATLDNFSEVS